MSESSRAPERAEEILSFWCGVSAAWDFEDARHKLWFGGAADTDEQVRTRYAADVERAAAGECDTWGATPRGQLALVLLFDQFPRNIFRGTWRAFFYDSRAQDLALDGLSRGDDRRLTAIERTFFYLPLEHAEDRELQTLSVDCYTQLADEAPPQRRAAFATFLDYAVRHRDIVERFGRFPHRNEILRRKSTPAELEFLAANPSGF